MQFQLRLYLSRNEWASIYFENEILWKQFVIPSIHFIHYFAHFSLERSIQSNDFVKFKLHKRTSILKTLQINANSLLSIYRYFLYSISVRSGFIQKLRFNSQHNKLYFKKDKNCDFRFVFLINFVVFQSSLWAHGWRPSGKKGFVCSITRAHIYILTYPAARWRRLPTK